MISLIFLTLVVIFLVNEARIAIYNLYFHPLRKFPGPKSWIAFPVLRYISGCRGDFDKILVQLHQKYGSVVRFCDDSLSFTTAQAWDDIYGYGHGTKQWRKQEFRPPNSEHNILFSDDEHHARFRKALAHSFSERSLQLQEGLIKKYIDALIFALREEAENRRAVDMTMWYNLTAFDISRLFAILVKSKLIVQFLILRSAHLQTVSRRKHTHHISSQSLSSSPCHHTFGSELSIRQYGSCSAWSWAAACRSH